MSKLLTLLFVSLMLAFIIEFRDKQLLRKPGKFDRFFTFLLIVLLASYCGLRTWYNDTVTYLQMYDQTPPLSAFWTSDDARLAGGVGFGWLNSFIKELGFSSQDYLMLYAFLTVTPYVLFVRKYCPHFLFGVFLMFTTGFYTFTFAAIKQCMATGICLLAVMAALDKKWIHFSLLMALAVLFHPYSIIYLVVPLMTFKPWTKWTYICIVVFIAMGFMLEHLLGTILDVTDLIGADYVIESFTGEGVNVFRVIVAFVPLGLAAVGGRKTFLSSTKMDNLMFNLAMLNALIMFVGLFGTANYFARLANYFLPGQIITIPYLLKRWKPSQGRVLTIACIIGYLGYFIYENAIIRPFDYSCSHMNFFDYISSLF